MFDKPTTISASKDAMMLSFVTQPAIIGGLFCDIKYTTSGNKLVEESNEISGVYGLDSYHKKYGTSVYQFTCKGKYKLYTTKGGKTVSFTTGIGEILTLKKISYFGKKLYGYFISGSKAGWMCFDNSLPSYAFKETWHFD